MITERGPRRVSGPEGGIALLRPCRYRYAAAALLLAVAGAASAAPALTVHPPRLALLVIPGGGETRTLTVVNETNLPVVAKLSFRDRHVRSDGSVESLAPGLLDRSSAAWLKLDERFLELAPWQKKEIKVRADVPREISGSYWCELLLEPVGDRGSGMESVVRIQVDGAGTIERKLVVAWTAFDRENDGRVRVKLRAMNEGNAYLSGRGSLLVRGEKTPTLENIPLAFFGNFDVEPSNHLDFDLVTRSPIPPGRYWVGVQIDIGGGEFVQRDTTVEFAAPPPEAPAMEEPAPRAEAPPPAAGGEAPPPESGNEGEPAVPPEGRAAEAAPTGGEEVPSASGGAPVVAPPPSVMEGGVPTYRVQLHATSDRGRAESYAERSAGKFDASVYVEFLAPYHKVFLGRDLSLSEARSLRERAIAAGHDGAWIVKVGLAPVPETKPTALEPPPEPPESASLRPPAPGLAYRVRLFSSVDEEEAADLLAAVETVFRHPLSVEAEGDGFALFVGRSLSGADAWAALERAKSFGFEEARIVEAPSAAPPE